MHIDLNNKIAVVCGSTQGIGLAVAEELATLGAKLLLIGRNSDKLKSVVAYLATPTEQQHEFLTADFTKPENLKSQITSWCESGNQAQILVNNTGGPPPGPAYSAALEDYLQAFSQHLICNQILVQALVPGMQASGYGRIINVISTSVKQPLANLGVSNSVRGAVASWAKTLASELGPDGITVNNVLPGATNTQRLASIMNNKAKKLGKSLEDTIAAEKLTIPLRRFAEPQEFAAAVAFLASPSAAYITGINLPVDGGRTGCL